MAAMMVGLLKPVAFCVAAKVCPSRRNSTARRLAALSCGSVDLGEEGWGTGGFHCQIMFERLIVHHLMVYWVY